MDKSKLIDDAVFVHDAAGSALTASMLNLALANLGRRNREQARIIAPPAQEQAYLLMGYSLAVTPGGGRVAHNGMPWVGKVELPPNVLLVECGGAHSVITNLQVPND